MSCSGTKIEDEIVRRVMAHNGFHCLTPDSKATYDEVLHRNFIPAGAGFWRERSDDEFYLFPLSAKLTIRQQKAVKQVSDSPSFVKLFLKEFENTSFTKALKRAESQFQVAKF